VRGLVEAARVWVEEGELHDACECVMEALRWLRSLSDAGPSTLALQAVAELWNDYLLSGDAAILKSIEAAAAAFPSLVQTPAWSIWRRYREYLCGKEPSLAAAELAPEMNPDLLNLHRLTEAMWEIRQSQEYWLDFPPDPAFQWPEPIITSPALSYPEIRIHAVGAQSTVLLGRWTEARALLLRWRERLETSRPPAGTLGLECVHRLGEALYWYWMTRGLLSLEGLEGLARDSAAGGLGRPLEEAEAESLVWFRSQCLQAPDEDSTEVVRRAGAAFQRSLQGSALIGFHGIVSRASFHYGLLLKDFTPSHERADNPRWYHSWEGLFSTCITLERSFGWYVHSPDIHVQRWGFFRELDLSMSARDAYEAYRCLRSCRFPVVRAARWNAIARYALNAYGTESGDSRHAVEVWQEWARELAAQPETRPFWTLLLLDNLHIEVANALMFASQGLRNLDNLDQAVAVLDEADVAFAAADPEVTNEQKETLEFRNLLIGLKFQRAWLLEQQRRLVEYRATIHDLCQAVKPADTMVPHAVNALVRLEALDQVLRNPWSFPAAPGYDPELPNLPLPSEWFGGEEPLRIARRVDLRLWQLWSLLNAGRRPTLDAIAALTRDAWRSLDRYPEIILGLAHSASPEWLGVESSALLRLLLEGMAFYFSSVEPHGIRELDALELLVNYNQDTGLQELYRKRYLESLGRHRDLLTREVIARGGSGVTDWYGIVREIHRWLEVLTKNELVDRLITEEQQRRGQSRSAFEQSLSRRREALRQARKDFEHDDHAACLKHLSDELPHTDVIWVAMIDLEILDLWLKSAVNEPAAADQIPRHQALLRKLALQYIRQISRTIPEEEGKQLALALLQDIDAHDKAAPRAA
jgi:hypothetical protein